MKATTESFFEKVSSMTARLFPFFAALAWAAAAPWAMAHGDTHGTKASTVREQKPWGIGGDPSSARTVQVRMTDDMRFRPGRIEVRQGETIRFVVRNDGRMLHEMVIGTKQALDEHAALMAKFPGMEHDEPFMAHIGPGQEGQIVWTFNRAGEFRFACLVPGHYEAGMVGTVTVSPNAKLANAR